VDRYAGRLSAREFRVAGEAIRMRPNDAVSQPSLAASILVLRPPDADAEVLVVRRKPGLRFLGGYWVFPGGSVDPSDASLYAAAARELFEETGLRIADVDRIWPWARWITPSTAKRRFDTHFFLTRAPDDQQARQDNLEIDSLRWIRPRDWAFGTALHEFPIAPPTQFILRELCEELDLHGSLDKLLAAAAHRQIRPVLPKVIDGDPKSVVFPWDPEHPRLPGETLAWDAEAIASRSHWPARLPLETDIHK
jgi:8-oxo-dGTP pyrophosphatase MutT (NUDIX family)